MEQGKLESLDADEQVVPLFEAKQLRAVGRPWERKFLGFRISADLLPLREIAPKAVTRFKRQVRQITRRARGVSIDRVVKDLRPYLRGWSEYFCWCETPWMLSDLDKWVRHRLRCYLWVSMAHAAATTVLPRSAGR